MLGETNKRNKFTKEFYDELINEKDINNVNRIVNIYNNPISKADKIIAFYNDTVDKYNNLMLKKLNKQFNENTIDIDIPIINTENNLSVKIFGSSVSRPQTGFASKE